MKNSEKAGFYPILINLNRFNCIIVGGGKVAYRKILSLLKFKADAVSVPVLSERVTVQVCETSLLKGSFGVTVTLKFCPAV